jgi:tyrosine-protein kinase Etk/Wzc
LSLQNTIKTLQPAILEDIRNQRSGVQASIADLTSTNNKYATVLESIPQQERELLEANRQQSIKNNVYTYLLQKKEETALSAASSVAFSRLVDEAESSLLPVSPKKPLIYGSALALAFLITIACITVKEGLTSTILFRSEIESYTKIPISAEISYSGGREIQLFLIEQFRHLRTALALHGTPAKKVILVTSSISGEGKSFICTNVAGALATSNKKAILIDMDLRNPRLSSIYKATNSPGITEYLNDNLPIEDIIRRTHLPNLFLIGAGKNRLNNAEVLLNGNLSSLFEKLRERFDYIIVDIAPIDPVSDAYLVSPYCDVTLFVVRHGKTPKTMVKLLDVNSKVKTLPNVSIVFNGIRPRGFIKNTYGYGYGYGYEYVYSYQKPEKKIKMLG